MSNARRYSGGRPRVRPSNCSQTRAPAGCTAATSATSNKPTTRISLARERASATSTRQPRATSCARSKASSATSSTSAKVPTKRRATTSSHCGSEEQEWALADSLAGIHCAALEPEDFKVLARYGASIVWSPLSNLLLYGQTANVQAAKQAGVKIGIGPRLVAQRQQKCARRAQGREAGQRPRRRDLL